MKEERYELIEWVNTLSDSHLSKEHREKWEKILSYCLSDTCRVIIVDEGRDRWIATGDSENKIEYQQIGN